MQLSLGSALSASVADSLSALLGDCRIWGSEEDPHFPVDSFLFTKSLDIVGACTTEVVEIKHQGEYPTDYFSVIIAAQIVSSGNFFPSLSQFRWKGLPEAVPVLPH